MKWPFRRSDPLTDPAVLDECLANPTTRASVERHLRLLEELGHDVTPENLTDLGKEQGMNRRTTMLMIALAWRLGAFDE